MNVKKSWRTATRNSALSVSALGLALVLTACGTKLDMAKLGTSVSDGIKSQLGLEVASVNCPQEERKAKAGDTFECEVTPKDGGKMTVKVTEKDDQGNVNWEVVKSEGFLSVPTVEESITKGLKEQANLDATVSCGDPKLRVSKPGETFDCKATGADGSANTVTVTVKDTEGNVSWALQQAQGEPQGEQGKQGGQQEQQ
jgi:hypothetical protein